MKSKDDLNKSESFCIMPWVHLATEPTGEVKICCLAKDRIRDENNKRYNLGYTDVNEIYNSAHFKDIRKRMFNGEKIGQCSHCWKEEDAGGISQRIGFTNEWLNNHPDLINLINLSALDDFSVDYAPMYYDFRFGNLCNLKCRSCGSLSSSQLNKEYKELKEKYPNTFFDDSGGYYDSINDWYQTDQFKNNVYDNIESIRKIYVTGGEPTLIEENYRIMEKLVELDRAKDVVVSFNTNMTNLRNDFYDLIVNFKQVEMCISIEGYGDIQEYLRFPSKWKQLDKNIRKLASLPQHVMIFAVPVIQNVNLEYATDFWNYIESINAEHKCYRIRLLPIVLDSPQMLDFTYLPKDYKLECLEKMHKFVDNAPNLQNDPHFMGRFNHIQTQCHSDSYDPEKLQMFKKYTTILDAQRGQSLQLVNPSLQRIIDNV